jgi:hypothetical protein
VRLLSDRIQEFIDWLQVNTDFGDWDQSVKELVHKQLIVFMISDESPTEESDHANDERR